MAFFRCIVALLYPIDRAIRGVRWWLVAHATAMFILLTFATAIQLHALSIDFIDNRNFADDGELPPGPLGYNFVIAYGVISTVYNVVFPLNQMLADGFLVGSVSNSVRLVLDPG